MTGDDNDNNNEQRIESIVQRFGAMLCRAQAKQTGGAPPADVVQSVREAICKRGIAPSGATRRDVKEAMKQLRLHRYDAHVVFVHAHVTGSMPRQFTAAEEQRFEALMRAIAKAHFETRAPGEPVPNLFMIAHYAANLLGYEADVASAFAETPLHHPTKRAAFEQWWASVVPMVPAALR